MVEGRVGSRTAKGAGTVKRWMGIVILMAALVGCGESGPSQGYVRAKDHHAAWDEHQTIMVCVGSDPKTGVCTVSVPVDDVTHHDEEWLLMLEDCDAKNKCRKGWHHVDADTWKRYHVGSHFPDPK